MKKVGSVLLVLSLLVVAAIFLRNSATPAQDLPPQIIVVQGDGGFRETEVPALPSREAVVARLAGLHYMDRTHVRLSQDAVENLFWGIVKVRAGMSADVYVQALVPTIGTSDLQGRLIDQGGGRYLLVLPSPQVEVLADLATLELTHSFGGRILINVDRLQELAGYQLSAYACRTYGQGVSDSLRRKVADQMDNTAAELGLGGIQVRWEGESVVTCPEPLSKGHFEAALP